jgi:Anti-sigma factor NepR
MNRWQTDEAAKLRLEALTRLGNGLGDYYGDVMKEVIPDRFTDLWRRLAAPTGRDLEKRRSKN